MSEADKYEVLEKIGHGSFGIIRKVRHLTTGEVLCRKEINYNRMSTKEREQLQAEFSILSTLRHPNIVGYYHREHLKSSMDLHLYMEYCGGGDLGQYIKTLQRTKKYAEEGFVWSIFTQLVLALYRCHYGQDAPPVGGKTFGFGNAVKPKPPSGNAVILHRDLKPENVFLGSDNSVKLGDFGLSKLMSSHDFASTYVGTPFYMSPEICAAERYTAKSDIWSLGCIIYELCTHEPPFNAKTHFQLVQKIKEGKTAPIPSCYGQELQQTIRDCLRVNPDRRPDTAALLSLPVVQLMRKETEVVELGKVAFSKEKEAIQKMEEAQKRLSDIESERATYRAELDDQLRREWEVKARLEIDRLVAIEVERLQAEFEAEVRNRVELEVAARLRQSQQDTIAARNGMKNDFQLSSTSTTTDADFPSSTDLSELSVASDSPETKVPYYLTSAAEGARRTPRAAIGRAQTMYMGAAGAATSNTTHNGTGITPNDIEMCDPSPMSIASLSLSPRKAGSSGDLGKQMRKNIFDKAAERPVFGERWQAQLSLSDSEDEEESLPMVASPSRSIQSAVRGGTGAVNGGFKVPARPVIAQRKTEGFVRSKTESSHTTASRNIIVPSVPSLTAGRPTLRPSVSSEGLRGQGLREALREKQRSPNRKLSKIPSSSNLNAELSSPKRQPSLKSKVGAPTGDLGKMAIKNNMALRNQSAPVPASPRGRSLVELAQARAGGRPIAVSAGNAPGSRPNSSASSGSAGSGGDENGTTSLRSGRPGTFAARMALRGSGGAGGKAPIWDPERDDMPSPFLVKRTAPISSRRL